MKNIGLFCVHGFLEDGLQSFQYLKDELEKNNIHNFYLTDLQGHSPDEDINTFNYKKCLEQVEEEYQRYKEKYDETYLIGFSMGGVIASHLASSYGTDKLVLISPAFKYGQGTQFFKDMLTLFNRSREDESFPSFREFFNYNREDRMARIQEFVNSEYKDLGTSYENFLKRLSKVNASTLVNFTRLVASVKRNLTLEGLPVRIYHAEFDELVPVNSSLYIFQHIKSEDKRLNLMAGVYHRILSSKLKDDIIDEIINFLYGNDYFKNEC